MHEAEQDHSHDHMSPETLYGSRVDTYTRSLIDTLWNTMADMPAVEAALLYELNGTPVNMHARFCNDAGLPTADLWERRVALVEHVDGVVMPPAPRTPLHDAFYDLVSVQPYL